MTSIQENVTTACCIRQHTMMTSGIRSIGRGINHVQISSPLLRRTFFSLPSFSSDASNLQTYRVRKRVNVTPQQMFRIVSDVSKYHEFVPFVEKSEITKVDQKTELPTEAVLRIGWNQFDEEFTSKIRCLQDQKVAVESLTILLFNNLHTEWEFKEVKSPHIKEPSCEVELNLKYSFKNQLYNAISSMFSDQVTKIMIKAFEQRAIEDKIKNKFKTRDVNFNKLK